MLVAGLRYCLGLGIAACATRFVNRYIHIPKIFDVIFDNVQSLSKPQISARKNKQRWMPDTSKWDGILLTWRDESVNMLWESYPRAFMWMNWIKKEALCETKSLFPSSIVTQFIKGHDMTFFCSNDQHIQLLEACVHTPAHASRA